MSNVEGRAPPAIARALRKLRVLNVLPGWNRVLTALTPQTRGSPYNFKVPFFNTIYRGNLGEHIDREVFFRGAYERNELEYARRLLCGRGPDPIVLDVGANTGHHTLAFLSYGACVHAFEPNTELHPALLARVAPLRSRVEVHGVGLWREDALLEFHLPDPKNPGLGTFVASEIGSDGSPGMVRVPVVSGDRFVRELGLERVDLIKVDVQGAEFEVLQGLRQTIAAHRPVLWLEISRGTRASMPTMNALRDAIPYRIGAVTTLRRSVPFLNIHRPGEITQTEFETFDGNLFIAPNAADPPTQPWPAACSEARLRRGASCGYC